MATLAPAEDERRPALGGGDLAGADVGDGVEPLEAPERGHRRGHELLGAGRRRGEALLEAGAPPPRYPSPSGTDDRRARVAHGARGS